MIFNVIGGLCLAWSIVVFFQNVNVSETGHIVITHGVIEATFPLFIAMILFGIGIGRTRRRRRDG